MHPVFLGFFCNGTTINPEKCPTGHYCVNGTKYSTEYKCPPGTFNNKTGQQSKSSCLICPPGKYCEGYGRIEPNGDCDPGFFCRGGADSARPGDIGALAASSTSPSATCYKPYDCICPALNSTTGNTVQTFYQLHCQDHYLGKITLIFLLLNKHVKISKLLATS